VGPRAGLDTVVKRKISSLYRDPNPPIIQPVAQRYTTDFESKNFFFFLFFPFAFFSRRNLFLLMDPLDIW
jgi:hypothetical protein